MCDQEKWNSLCPEFNLVHLKTKTSDSPSNSYKICHSLLRMKVQCLQKERGVQICPHGGIDECVTDHIVWCRRKARWLVHLKTVGVQPTRKMVDMGYVDTKF